MSQVTAITKPFLRDARVEMMVALREFGERHGLVVTVGNASFIPGVGGSATFKVELATKTADGVVNTKEMIAFQQHATLFGLKPEHLGTQFTWQSSRFQLAGLAPRSAKYPLLATKLADGKMYKLPLAAVEFLRTPAVVR